MDLQKNYFWGTAHIFTNSSKNNIPISIYAHEPLPSLQTVANKLQQINNITYHLSSIALSDYDGVSDFYVSARSDASNSLISGFRPSKEIIQVKVNTLDEVYLDLLKNYDYDEFLLMVDVETAEPQVLRGAEKVIKNYRPKIICEVLSGRTESELQTIMSSYEYTFYRYVDESWVLEEKIFGDSSYKNRDWLFLPKEESIRLGSILKI